MAEFVEVIKIKNRMHETYVEDCLKCPLDINNNGRKVFCGEFLNKYPKENERVCLEWAKKHIQTNENKFEEVFGFKPARRCLNPFPCTECDKNGNTGCEYAWWEQEYKTPTEKQQERVEERPIVALR